MESRDEIKDMTVAELNEFFKRHGVNKATIKSSRPGAIPNKEDLQKHALKVRKEFEQRLGIKTPSKAAAAAKDESESDDDNKGKEPKTGAGSIAKPNLFQKSSPHTSVEKAKPSVKKEGEKKSTADAGEGTRRRLSMDSSPERPKTPATDRRKSVGWASEELLGLSAKKVLPSAQLSAKAAAESPRRDSSSDAELSLAESSGKEDTSSDDEDGDLDMEDGGKYDKMSYQELRKLAHSRGLKDTRMKKAQIVALLKGQDMQTASVSERKSSSYQEKEKSLDKDKDKTKSQPKAPSPRIPVAEPAVASASAAEPPSMLMSASPKQFATPSRDTPSLPHDRLTFLSPARRFSSSPIAQSILHADYPGAISASKSWLMGFTGSLASLLVLVVALIWILYGSGTYFCSSTPSNINPADCVPCPEHAMCVDGMMTCLPGFQKIRSRCVESKETALAVEWMRGKMESMARHKLGEKQCGRLKPAEDGSLSYEELSMAMVASPSGSNIPANAPPDWIYRLPKDTKQRVFSRAFELISHQSNMEFVNEEKDRIRSSEASKPWDCVVYEFVYEHILAMVIALVGFIVGLVVLIQMKVKSSYEAMVNSAYLQVVAILQEQHMDFQNGTVKQPWMVDTHLRDELFSHLKDTKRRTQIWKDVERRLRYDSRTLHSGPKQVYGVPCYTWEWIAAPTPSKRSTQKRDSADGSGRIME